MSNDFYNHTGYPANSADGRAIDQRAELLALQAAFEKMPALSGNADKLVIVNAGASGLTVTPIGKYQMQGSWTPVLTCATPGNLTIVYSTQLGQFYRLGQMILVTFELITSTFTHTTASGAVSITGLPVTCQTSGFRGSLEFSGLTKANYTQFAPMADALSSAMSIRACGSAQAGVALAITDFPTGGTVLLRGTLWYLAQS